MCLSPPGRRDQGRRGGRCVETGAGGGSMGGTGMGRGGSSTGGECSPPGGSGAGAGGFPGGFGLPGCWAADLMCAAIASQSAASVSRVCRARGSLRRSADCRSVLPISFHRAASGMAFSSAFPRQTPVLPMQYRLCRHHCIEAADAIRLGRSDPSTDKRVERGDVEQAGCESPTRQAKLDISRISNSRSSCTGRSSRRE
jgi:hypothetical protein